MAKPETTPATARAPRGAKPVSRAFFAALEGVPEATRDAVAKAAQAMIRDEMKVRRDKAKAAAAKEKARKAAAAKSSPGKAATAKSPAVKPAAAKEVPEAAPKRRGRKPAVVPAAA